MLSNKKLSFLTIIFLCSIFSQNTINADNLQTDSVFLDNPKVVAGKSDGKADGTKYAYTSQLTEIGKLANQALGNDMGSWDSFLIQNCGWDASSQTITNALNQANSLRQQINSAKTTAEKNALIKQFESTYGIKYNSNNSSIGEVDYYTTSDGVLVKKLQPSVKNFKYLDKIVFTFQRLDGTTNVKVDTAKTISYLKQKNSSIFSKYGGRTPTITQSGNTVTIDFDGQLVNMHDFIRDTWTGTHNNVKPVMYATFPQKTGMYKITAKVYAGNYKELSDFYGFTSEVYGLNAPCKYCHPVPANAKLTTKKVYLYKKPNSDSEKIGYISAGQRVIYQSKSGSYSKVKYGKYTGYILTSALKTEVPDKCDYRAKAGNRLYSKYYRSNGSAGSEVYRNFYRTHPTSNYKIPFYDTEGWNGTQISGVTNLKMGGLNYQLEYWPYKETFVKVHNKAAEKANLITSTNGYIKLQSKKTNKVPDGVQTGILVASYEWRIGVMEKSTPIPGDTGKNADIGSTLTK